MNVFELEELCAQVKDKNMEVFFGKEDTIVGGFIFTKACIVESGVTGLGAPEDVDGTGPIERHIFALMPCGQVCAEQNKGEADDDEEMLPSPEIFN